MWSYQQRNVRFLGMCRAVLHCAWLFLLVVSVCLAFSAFYEMLEWWTALLGGVAATVFLGTQGDVWDTQWDMFLAGVGAITGQLLLGRRHDRQLVRVDARVGAKVAAAATAC